jgi:hypothetical protein
MSDRGEVTRYLGRHGAERDSRTTPPAGLAMRTALEKFEVPPQTVDSESAQSNRMSRPILPTAQC